MALLTNIVFIDDLKLLDEIGWVRTFLNLFFSFEFANKLVVGDVDFCDDEFSKTRAILEIVVIWTQRLAIAFVLLGVIKS